MPLKQVMTTEIAVEPGFQLMLAIHQLMSGKCHGTRLQAVAHRAQPIFLSI
jgi:hypothetical protein